MQIVPGRTDSANMQKKMYDISWNSKNVELTVAAAWPWMHLEAVSKFTARGDAGCKAFNWFERNLNYIIYAIA